MRGWLFYFNWTCWATCTINLKVAYWFYKYFIFNERLQKNKPLKLNAPWLLFCIVLYYFHSYTNHFWEPLTLQPAPCCCLTLRNWLFNTLLAGRLLDLVACIQHCVINLPYALKSCITAISLFAACPLFTSCKSCPWQLRKMEDFCCVQGKPQTEKNWFQSVSLWGIKGLIWTMGIWYCGSESHKSQSRERNRITREVYKWFQQTLNHLCIRMPLAMCQQEWLMKTHL